MKSYLALFALSLCLFVNSINADTLLSDTTNITVIAQSNSKDYATAGFENFNNISLDVHAVGDYDEPSNEFINFNIDGVDFGSYNVDTPGVTATNVGLPAFDWDLQFSILITDLQWTNFISDSILNITWSNGIGTGAPQNVQHFVSYEINGDLAPVPVPSAFLLLGSGLIWFAGMRRKFLKTIRSA